MFEYSIIYFVNAFSIFTNKRNKRILRTLVIILLVLLSGTRYYMGGTDVYAYEAIYKNIPSFLDTIKWIFLGDGNGLFTFYEPGFVLICSIIKAFHFTYFGFILLYTCLFYGLMIRGLRDFVPNWAIFIALFMYKIMFYNTFISIRQGLTIAIFCCGLNYIRDRKMVKYFIVCLVAFFVHRGALILFPLYFITYIPTSKKFVTIFLMIFLPLRLLNGYINIGAVLNYFVEIFNFANNTFYSSGTKAISNIHLFECYIIGIAILFFYNVLFPNKEDNNGESLTSLGKQKEIRLSVQLYMVLIPLFTLFSGLIVLTREKDYFVIFYGVILGYIFNGLMEQWKLHSDFIAKKNAIILWIILIIACFIGMTRYVIAFDNANLLHYRSFLFQEVSIFD